MENYSIVVEFIKYTGGAGLIALIWWFYHKSITGYLTNIFEQQQERDKESSANLNKIIEQQGRWYEKNFQLLQEMISSNMLQSEKIQELNTKIDNNNWCPVWRYLTHNKDFSFSATDFFENNKEVKK